MKRNSIRVATLAWLVCSVTFFLPAATPFGGQCPPITPLNDYEKVVIEASSNKYGCWVRDEQGQLFFLSPYAPPKDYKPVLKDQGKSRPSAGKQPGSSVSHGATNPALYPLMAGTWEGTFCGLKTTSMRFSAAGSMLSGTIKSYSVAMNQECDSTQGDLCFNSNTTKNTPTCESLEPRIIDETPVQASLVNGGFDGRTLWFSVTAESQTREIQWQFSGDKLILNDPEGPPTIYRKVQ